MTKPDLSAIHARLATAGPLIQNITNTVVQQFSANVLLAIGAAPAMIDHEADAGQFAALANAIVVNFGTADSHQLLAADAAIRVANTNDTPWLLDPVSVGVVDYRSTRIQQALEYKPPLVRGNASEIAALAGMGAGGRGTDTTDAVDAALPAAVRLATTTGGIVAISGACDAVVMVEGDTVRIARIHGGHTLMPRVIGTGCSLGSATAAYVAAQRHTDGTRLASDFDTTIAAHAHFALAGQQAGAQAHGPGSFPAAFLDALHALTSDDITQARVHIDSYPLTSFSA